MRVAWKSGEGFDVGIRGLPLTEAIAAALRQPLALAAIGEMATAARKRARFKPDLADGFAERMAREFLAGGRPAVAAALEPASGMVSDLAADEVRRAFRTPDSFLAGLRDAIDRDTGADIVDAVDAIREQALALLEGALVDRVGMLLPEKEVVELHRAVSAEPLSFSGRGRSVATVEPDAALAALFEAANVSMDDFREGVLARHGIDLLGGAEDAALVEFLSAHSFGFSRNGAMAVARAWKDFSPVHSPTRAPALAASDILLMLEGAGAVAQPVCVSSIPLRRLVDAGSGWTAMGETLLGLVDPGSATGYLAKAAAGVEFPASSGEWSPLADLEEGADEEEAFSLRM